MFKKGCATILLLAGLSSSCFALLQSQIDFINVMVKKHHFKKTELTGLFAGLDRQHRILKKINHPLEAVSWHRYQNVFLTKKRIDKGVKYWDKHKAALNYASKKYGVPPSIILGIIGVETQYGDNLGNIKVLDSLNTLSFYYPKRATFFKKELSQFLLMCREQKLNPKKIKGSYAGAMGLGQFMPSSYRYYAKGYKHHDHIDLSKSGDDAIVSIANYLYQNKWQPNNRIAVRVHTKGLKFIPFLSHDVGLKYQVATLSKVGVKTAHTFPPSTKVSLLSFKGKKEREYYLTAHDFKTIMSYNTSPLYAMAVLQVGNAIKAKHGAEKTKLEKTKHV